MRYRIVVALACLLSSTFSIAATQEGTSKSQSGSKLQSSIANLKAACKADLSKYCANVTPGEGRLASCLNSREDQLSDSCRTAWGGTKARASRELDKTEVAFRKNCGSDVQKFCSNVPSGRGRLLSCLGQHKNDLSASCQNFETALNQRLSKALG